MKKTLFTIVMPLLIVLGTLSLLFLTNTSNKSGRSSSRRWLTDKLILLYTENTTDPFEDASSYVLSFTSGNRRMIDTIQLEKLENRYICDGQLFVMSTLQPKGDHSFRKNSVIDVYLLNDKRYEGSFHIPGLQGKDVMSIHLLNGFLVAFCQHSFSIYAFPKLNSYISANVKALSSTGLKLATSH